MFRPLLSEFVVSMPRGAAVVYPKDAAQIVAMADIFPGAARGRGRRRAPARSPARCCARSGPHGRVSSYERREEFADVARRNVDPVLRREATTRRGRSRSATSPRRCRRRGSGATGSSWTCWRPGTASTRRPARCAPGGIVCAYVATTTQLSRFVETVRVHGGFTEPQAWESLVRDWHVEGLAVRPGHKMIGHTAFLVTARRMAPGQPRRR